MNDQLSVSGKELERKRKLVAALSKRSEPRFGWDVDSETAGKIVSVFPHVQVKTGFRLVTLLKREQSGGNGRTYAIPKDASFPARSMLEENEPAPAPPKCALPNVMDAIDGDAGLRSYVGASILSRELDEFGAWWHGIGWGAHSLLDGKAEPASLSRNWKWQEDQSKNRSPVAVQSGSAISVTFWTVTALGQESVIRHTDIYKEGSLSIIDSLDHTVATGPGGIIP